MRLSEFYPGQEVYLCDPESPVIGDGVKAVVKKVSIEKARVTVRTRDGRLNNWACYARVDGHVYSGDSETAQRVTQHGGQSVEKCGCDRDESDIRTTSPAPRAQANALLAEIDLMQLSPIERDFLESGITNRDGVLTEDGQDVFLQWLFDAKPAKTGFYDNVVKKLVEQRKKQQKG